MNEVGSTMDFTSMRNNTLPMMLNGKAVDVDKVTLFPGSYTLSTGTDIIAYGRPASSSSRAARRLPQQQRPDADADPGGRAGVRGRREGLRPGLPAEAGAVAAQLPQQAGNGGATSSTSPAIKWKQRGAINPYANVKPRLDYDSPNVAEVQPNLQLTVSADCSSPTGCCELNTYSFKDATINMLEEPLVVRWVD